MWDALLAGGAAPVGLGARDTLRLEVCFHLYGNDLMEDRGPIEAGLGWCCKEDTGFIGAEAVRAARAAGPAEKLVPFAMTGPGIARQGNPVVGRRRGDVGHAVAEPRHRDRDGLPARRTAPSPGPRSRSTCAARPATRRSPDQAAVPEGELNVAEASYPDDLRYHAEHDWARIDGDVATFGITWYAQDQLGEVVFFDPPEVGKTVAKDEPYAEVESVKAVSDVDRPAVGRDRRGQRALLGDAPETINDDPYGDGWMVKVRLSDVSELDELLDAADLRGQR